MGNDYRPRSTKANRSCYRWSGSMNVSIVLDESLSRNENDDVTSRDSYTLPRTWTVELRSSDKIPVSVDFAFVTTT